jgi:CRP/FNR family cyclic AMP-dependent transcriptional regulator
LSEKNVIERFSKPEMLKDALLNQRSIRGNESLARELAACVRLRSVDEGQSLIEQGGDDNDIYFILAGRFDIVVNGRKIAARGPGDHVGEMAAILPSLRRSATVQAFETGVVAALTAPELMKLADKFPSMWRHFAGVLAERLFQRNALVTATHAEIKVFVISSAEALAVARAVQEIFAHDPFRVTLWTDGVFRASQYAVESLVQILDVSDFAIAIAQADDFVKSRGETKATPRDNVLFELGLFIGRLGRLRTFLLEPRQTDVRLPSDLSGITTIPYETGSDAQLLTLLGPACNQLRRLFKEIGPNN